MATNVKNCVESMSGVYGTSKKEGQRRASAQLLLPWVDEMLNIYTRDARIVNTQRWIFDGFLMANQEIEA